MTVIVADATLLERNLNLVIQVLEITDRAVLCLNLMDEGERRGMVVDDRRLARDLGVPVVPTVARRSQGIPELLQAVADVATGRTTCKPHRIEPPPGLKAAVEELQAEVSAAFPGLPNARWVSLRLLEGDPRIVEAVRSGEIADLGRHLARASSEAGGARLEVS